MKTVDELIKELDEHESAVYEVIITEVKRLALFVLQNNKSTKEFIMGMGMMSITRKRGSYLHDFVEDYEFEKLNGGKALYDFIYTHNDRFKITGDPMRFMANGVITTDW